MNKLVELKNEYREVKENYLVNKVELERYENYLFYEWKKDNPKSRDAKDKILTSLLMEDQKLQEITSLYNEAKIEYELLKIEFDFMMKLLDRNDLNINEIKEML